MNTSGTQHSITDTVAIPERWLKIYKKIPQYDKDQGKSNLLFLAIHDNGFRWLETWSPFPVHEHEKSDFGDEVWSQLHLEINALLH